jgi:hypothetical protein
MGREQRTQASEEGHLPATDKADQEDLIWLLQRTPYWYWPKRVGPHF